MRYIFVISVLILLGCNRQSNKSIYLQESNTVLSPPKVSIDDVFFEIQTMLRVPEIDESVDIRYTSDGSEPTEISNLADEVIKVNDSGIFKFKAFRSGMIPSKTVEVEAFATRKVNWIGINATTPHEKYTSSPSVFSNKIKGDFNFHSDEWCGYQDSIVSYSISLEKNEEVNGIVLSTLVDQKSWIFAPEFVSLTYTFSDETTEIHRVEEPESHILTDKHMRFIKINTETRTPIKIDIQVHNLTAIPDWHPGKGLKPWLFVDEILIL